MSRLLRLALTMLVGIPCVLVALTLLPTVGAAAVLVACVRRVRMVMQRRGAVGWPPSLTPEERIDASEAQCVAARERVQAAEERLEAAAERLDAAREHEREQALGAWIAHGEFLRRGGPAMLWWN